MSMRRRGRARREGTRADINMNSLIDLTFILLVVFIVTLPALENVIHVHLPIGKAEKQKESKNIQVSVDMTGKIFVGDRPVTHDDLEKELAKAIADDPETSVVIRGDVKSGYGDVYEVVKAARKSNVKNLGLASLE